MLCHPVTPACIPASDCFRRMECQFDFSLSDQRLVRTGFLLCLPRLLAAVLLHDQRGFMATAFPDTKPHRREQAFCCIAWKGKEANLALCFNQHIDGIQPLKTVAVQFFCGQGRHEKSQVRQRYPAASVQTAEKRPRIRIFSQRVTLMAAFFGLRHRPPCGLLLCAERNQCL
ncbi:hypothetical+protein [Escherichia coli]|uniref:Uncharacterized protein n=1 Tax=Escherichia coli TaxID=562 RepID=A0ABD7WG97_ECOLX|nr:hypothetical+protein [Escherichia coli]VZR47390.1 Uncharacterised protein [Escherichia coli]VZR53254.1 Uncharacterised protein [Escherichia coli]